MTRYLFAAAAVALAGPAFANSMEVRVGDLNLATAQGRATLDDRIDAAEKTLCPAAEIRDLRAQNWAANCRRVARASVVPQVAALVARAETRLAQAESGRAGL